MRILVLDEADYELFDVEISSESFNFINKHMDAFKRMWNEQGKKFWLHYLLTFRSSFYGRKLGKIDIPEHEIFFKTIMDEACIFLHQQFIEGRYSEVKNLLLEIIILAQNHNSLQFLESSSFAKDPFYAKNTREAFRHLFGNPCNKISTWKVYKLAPMYMRFVGSLHCLLRRWLQQEDQSEIDDSYWTLKNRWKEDSSYKPFIFECFLIQHYKESLFELLAIESKEISWLDNLIERKDKIKIATSEEIFFKTGEGKLQCNEELLSMIGLRDIDSSPEIDLDDKKKKKKKKKKARKDCADDDVKMENESSTSQTSLDLKQNSEKSKQCDDLEIARSRSVEYVKFKKHKSSSVLNLISSFKENKTEDFEVELISAVKEPGEMLINGEVDEDYFSPRMEQPAVVAKSKSDDIIKYGETNSEQSEGWATLSSEDSLAGEFADKINCSDIEDPWEDEVPGIEETPLSSNTESARATQNITSNETEYCSSRIKKKLDEIGEHKEKIGTDLEYVNKLLEAHKLLTGKKDSYLDGAAMDPGIEMKKSKALKLRMCANCRKPETEPKTYKKCKRCKTEDFPEPRYYCGRECQVEDWEENHKDEHMRFTLQNNFI